MRDKVCINPILKENIIEIHALLIMKEQNNLKPFKNGLNYLNIK